MAQRRVGDRLERRDELIARSFVAEDGDHVAGLDADELVRFALVVGVRAVVVVVAELPRVAGVPDSAVIGDAGAGTELVGERKLVHGVVEIGLAVRLVVSDQVFPRAALCEKATCVDLLDKNFHGVWMKSEITAAANRKQ